MTDRDITRDDPSERVDIEPILEDIEQIGDGIDESMPDVDTDTGVHDRVGVSRVPTDRVESSRAAADRVRSSRAAAERVESGDRAEHRAEGVPPGLAAGIASGLAAIPSGVEVPDWFMRVVPVIYDAAMRTAAEIFGHRRPGETLGERITLTVKNMREMQAPVFDGRVDAVGAARWLSTMEHQFTTLRITDDEVRIGAASRHLQGAAAEWWTSYAKIHGSQLTSWNQFTSAFLTRYVPLTDRRQWERDFQVLVQGRRSVSDYADEFDRLARYAPDLVRTEMQRVHRFVSGLNARIRRNLGANMEREKFETVVEIALQAELDERGVDEEHALYQPISVQGQSTARWDRSTVGVPQQQRVHPSGGIQIGSSSGQQGRGRKRSRDQRDRGGQGQFVSGRPPKSEGCHECGDQGHIVRYCPRIQCRSCEGWGHMQMDCPLSRRAPQGRGGGSGGGGALTSQGTTSRQSGVGSSSGVRGSGQTQSRGSYQGGRGAGGASSSGTASGAQTTQARVYALPRSGSEAEDASLVRGTERRG